MYDAPINVTRTMGDLIREIDEKTGEEVYKAVFEMGVIVDKDELLRALQYDRGQYEKGYQDAMERIVRCRDCKFAEPHPSLSNARICGKFKFGTKRLWMKEDSYCSEGERKDNEEDEDRECDEYFAAQYREHFV